ncbi:DUF3566 domain-containing protein [Dietzia sp. SL131]|uniref:DUF3566 domain-containing protein n=1 Tax=Dietzia sp. SL131 TaxID=2995149 RepID=UPI00227AE596|nr:DUF3566 domain-containing protein [Dietzia sp. SL131]MCY1658661.1 DUF3566 domain-containing protein [Dietzia sp. SL131]
MTEPTDPGTDGPAPKGSAPTPGYGAPGTTPETSASDATTSSQGSGSSSTPAASTPAAETTRFPTATPNRAEGSGGVSRAYSGGAAGQAAPIVSPAERRGPLESTLVLRRIDPWSAFTTVLGLMFALYLVWMVAIGVTYLLLSGMGVWDRLGGLLSGVAGDESASVIGPSTIFLYSGGVGLLNVLLLSILATLAVFIYNLAAGLTGGGVQVTLGDRRS